MSSRTIGAPFRDKRMERNVMKASGFAAFLLFAGLLFPVVMSAQGEGSEEKIIHSTSSEEGKAEQPEKQNPGLERVRP